MPSVESTALTHAMEEGDEACRLLIRRALLEEAGHVVNTARRLGVSRAHLWKYLNLLGMGDEPAQVRSRAQRRLRLQKVDEEPT